MYSCKELLPADLVQEIEKTSEVDLLKNLRKYKGDLPDELITLIDDLEKPLERRDFDPTLGELPFMLRAMVAQLKEIWKSRQ